MEIDNQNRVFQQQHRRSIKKVKLTIDDATWNFRTQILIVNFMVRQFYPQFFIKAPTAQSFKFI